jgi:thiol-disulfide isomerase/thioredoxin
VRRASVAIIAVVGALLVSGEPESARAQSNIRPWLGVELDSREPATSDAQGVRVRHAVRSSPAWKAGIRDGEIILRVEDVAVSTPDDVIREVGTRAPGASVRVVLVRGTAQVPVQVVLAPMPEADEMLRIDKVGTVAPPFKGLSSVSGPLPVPAELRGRVVIVDFWATWCTACRLSAPKLSVWQAKFGAQGLSVVGITEDEVGDAVRGVSSFGMKYASVASDPGQSTSRAFGVRALPTVFIIDKRGVVRDVVVGFDRQREAETERLLQRLLAEPAP